MSYASAGEDSCGSYPVTGVCIQNTENINDCDILSEEEHYCILFCSQQHGFGPLTFAIENFNISRLLVLFMKLRATST
jgi:hypothetical protein